MKQLREQLDALAREIISDALTRTNGNLSAAARLLGENQPTLQRRARRLGIDPKQFGPLCVNCGKPSHSRAQNRSGTDPNRKQ